MDHLKGLNITAEERVANLMAFSTFQNLGIFKVGQGWFSDAMSVLADIVFYFVPEYLVRKIAKQIDDFTIYNYKFSVTKQQLPTTDKNKFRESLPFLYIRRCL